MSPEDALLCAQGYIDLFLVGDEVVVDLFDGDERAALIHAFQELGYDVVVTQDSWAFTVRARERL